ncbi:carbon-nitrogen hydrolase family protein [Longimicrobium sp.]|uniref:carbon-nitrogen hydrolase family protein n=1 Tax=Longimicrobium sp. TaxID=2029185 RepID=UPI002BE05DE8|nr:carbon-nitrogen hydrolase family protein [Longimicrobium sp.]HSU16297.1 carbon-nitrogen hydrolase family protein [Longimicrobium sp.]
MIIALASPRVASSVGGALEKIRLHIAEAAGRGAEIVCFPEAYLPGLRGLDFEVPPFDREQQEQALASVSGWARTQGIAVVLGMEWISDAGRQIASVVFDSSGESQGVQTKNQLDPTEEPLYVHGDRRQIFEIGGVKFGIAICHEAFRYPETVRWAAVRGAKIVFHPHCTGSDRAGPELAEWGSAAAPYYEKAMMCRGLENGIFFASVNYAFRYQESATTIVGPSGECVAHLPYGEEGVLVREIDTDAATGLLASRYAPERYRDSIAE